MFDIKDLHLPPKQPILQRMKNLETPFRAWRSYLVLTAAVLLLTEPVRAEITVLNYWRMGENDSGALAGAAATNTTDFFGNDTLTVFGPALYSTNVSAAALADNASSLSITFTNSAFASNGIVSTVQNNFGIEAWVKPSSTAGNPILVYNGNTGLSGWGIIIQNSAYMGLLGDVTYLGSSPVTLGVWTHVALVRNNGVATFYVNGVAVGTSTATPIIPAGGFAIGATPSGPQGQFFTGAVDEVRVFTFGVGQFTTNDLLINSRTAIGVASRLEGSAAGSDSIALQSVPYDNTWPVTANASWLHLPYSSGSGDAVMVFNFDANPGLTRTGLITIAGQELTVTQAGTNYTATEPVTTLLTNDFYFNELSLDSAGNIYFYNDSAVTVEKWTVTNNTLSTLLSGLGPCNPLTCDAAGNIYFYEGKSNTLNKWTAASNTVTTLVSATVSPPLDGPSALTVDAAGNVYIASPNYGTVREWLVANGSLTNLVSGLVSPQNLAVDVAGNVYIGDSDNGQTYYCYKWTAQTGQLGVLISSTSFNADGLAVDGAGNIFIADYYALYELPATNTTLVTINTASSDLLAVAVDKADNVFVIDDSITGIRELPRAFVATAANSVSLGGGSSSLPVVLPASEDLAAPFAPTTDEPWLTATAANGLVNFSFAQSTTNRTGHITVLGQSVPILQDILTASLTPNTLSEPSTAGTNTVSLTVGQPLVVWTATANATWLHLSAANQSGAGNTNVTFSFDANQGAPRTGTLTIAGQILTITQAGTAIPGFYPAAVLADHPLAYWPLNETNGSVAYDHAGANNGTYYNTILAQPGPTFGGFGLSNLSAQWPGSIAYVDIPEGSFNLTNTLTVTAWVYMSPKMTNYSDVVGHGDGSWSLTVTDPDEPSGTDGYIDDLTSDYFLTNGGWHMLALTYSGSPGSEEILYVDGNEYDSATAYASAGNNLDVWIGDAPDHSTTRAFLGNIAHVAVFTNVLSQSQIDSLYYAATAAPLAATQPATGVEPASAMVNGSVLAEWFPTTAYFVYGTNTNYGQTNIISTRLSATNTLPYSTNLTGLLPSTLYHFQIIASNSYGLSLGGDLTFTTPANFSLGTTSILEGPSQGSNTVVLGSAVSHSNWTATANASWLHLGSKFGSGSGSTNVVFSFDANSGATRSGTLTIAGLTLTVAQAGATYVPANILTNLVTSNLYGPQGLAVDGSGNVYIADTGGGAIQEWIPATDSLIFLVSAYYPAGVAVDNAGNVYIANPDHYEIDEWSPVTQTARVLVSPNAIPQLDNPTGVALDQYSNLYIANNYSNQTDLVFSGTTNPTILFSSGLNQPTDVAVDAAGNVYAVNGGNHSLTEWVAATSNASTIASAFADPQGVAVDGSGNVYIADTVDGLVKEWVAVNSNLVTLANIGAFVYGVAVDHTGNVYMADTGNSLITELTCAFVNPTPKTENEPAGTDSLPVVLPASENLMMPFAPASDHSWLQISSVNNGIVSFTFTANPGLARTAHISLLGQTIPVTQSGVIAPDLTGFKAMANGSFQFAFTNYPGATFTVLSTTNLAVPLTNWTAIGVATNISSGQYQFSSPPTTNKSPVFYRVVCP